MGQWQPGLPLKDPGCVPAASRTGHARYYCPGPRFEKLCVLWWGKEEAPQGKGEARDPRFRDFRRKGSVYLLGGDSLAGERNLGEVCEIHRERLCLLLDAAQTTLPAIMGVGLSGTRPR